MEQQNSRHPQGHWKQMKLQSDRVPRLPKEIADMIMSRVHPKDSAKEVKLRRLCLQDA